MQRVLLSSILATAVTFAGATAARAQDDGADPGWHDPDPEPAPLVVPAQDPPKPAPAATPTAPKTAPAAATQACPPNPAPTSREGVSFSGSLYVLSGVALDDFSEAGFLVRPSLDLGASFGLGDVSLYLNASAVAIEAALFSGRTSTSVPFLATVGVRSDTWTLAAAGGLSAAVDNDYGDRADVEHSLVSPRGEIKAGYRFEGFIEILGHVGIERRRFDNREDTTRLIFGASFGFAGP
jgi:hypothetical protein